MGQLRSARPRGVAADHTRRFATWESDLIEGGDRRHVEFLAGADLLIHDAQYVAAEYPSKVGWGHSTVECVARSAGEAGVRRLALFHHDQLRDDDAVDRVVEVVRGRLSTEDPRPQVFGTSEGQVIDLGRRRSAAGAAPVAPAAAARSASSIIGRARWTRRR